MNSIKIKNLTNTQCEELLKNINTDGFKNYFNTREKRIKLIYSIIYMNNIYKDFKNNIVSTNIRYQKQSIAKNFLNDIKIDIPQKFEKISDEDWFYIKNSFTQKYSEEESNKMENQKKEIEIATPEEIKEKLNEATKDSQELISEISLPREQVQREVEVIKKERKRNKRSIWRDYLVHDLITDTILPCDEYLLSKGSQIKKGNTYHIEHEVEVMFKGQKLNARWVKNEDGSLQMRNQEL